MTAASAQELASLTGLDVQTVSDQVFPHLESYTQPEPLRLYLEVGPKSLVGSTGPARQFIQKYLSSKFGPAQRQQYRSPGVPPVPASTNGGALSTPLQTRSKHKGKGKYKEATEQEALATLSSEEAAQVAEIDRSLKLLSLPGDHPVIQKAKCFCQGHLGRRHPLSNYTRLCTSCGLILCSLNLPSRPCPSCLASPLLSSQQLLAHKTSQLKRREALIAEGKERYTLATQVEQEEQQRMMFPSLNIAERAGGISEIQRRIDNAYTDNDRRVLTLDLKTKKVMTQTMRKKDSSMPKSKVENLEAELGLDVEPGWIDPTDDGYVNQVRDGKAPPVAPSPAAEIIHYVSKDQGEDSPPEQDDEAADEADQEGHDRPSGPPEVSAAPASRNTETKSSKGQQSKGKGKAVSNADKKDKGKGKERQKVPGQM